MSKIEQQVTPPRPVTQTDRCPFCGSKLVAHCSIGSMCKWLRCTDSSRCHAFGPASGMVRV